MQSNKVLDWSAASEFHMLPSHYAPRLVSFVVSQKRFVARF